MWTGSTWANAAFTASGFLVNSNNLSDVSNTSTARTNLGLAIGTNVQAWDANLDAWALRKAPTTDGTTNQVLTSQGTGVAPIWASAASGGAQGFVTQYQGVSSAPTMNSFSIALI